MIIFQIYLLCIHFYNSESVAYFCCIVIGIAILLVCATLEELSIYSSISTYENEKYASSFITEEGSSVLCNIELLNIYFFKSRVIFNKKNYSDSLLKSILTQDNFQRNLATTCKNEVCREIGKSKIGNNK